MTNRVLLVLLAAAAAFAAACGGPDGDDDEEGKGGNGSCAAIMECIGACGTEDCATSCIEEGSAQGQQDLEALATCIERNHCGEDGNCIAEFCADELVPCVERGGGNGGSGGTGGTGGVGGTGGTPSESGFACMDLWSCALACETDACLEQCYDGSSAEGRQLFVAVVECIEAYECPDMECVESYCPDELQACADDTSGG